MSQNTTLAESLVGYPKEPKFAKVNRAGFAGDHSF